MGAIRKHFPKLILCACNCCGEFIYDKDKRGRPIKFKKGHWKKGKKYPNSRPMYKGEKHWNWQGGRYLDSDGYMKIRITNHPFASNGYVLEHRYIMEKHLGRYLTKDEHVHHINENKLDNHLDNLIIMERGEHVKLHHHIKREMKSRS